MRVYICEPRIRQPPLPFLVIPHQSLKFYLHNYRSSINNFEYIDWILKCVWRDAFSQIRSEFQRPKAIGLRNVVSQRSHHVILTHERWSAPLSTDNHHVITIMMDHFNIQTMSLESAVFFLVFVGCLVVVRRIVDYRAAVVGIQYVSCSLLQYINRLYVDQELSGVPRIYQSRVYLRHHSSANQGFHAGREFCVWRETWTWVSSYIQSIHCTTHSHHVTQSFQASRLGCGQRCIGVANCNYYALRGGCRIDQGQVILSPRPSLWLRLLFTGNHVISPPLAQTRSPISRSHIFWKKYCRVRGQRLETVQESHSACILWCECSSVNLPAAFDWRQ